MDMAQGAVHKYEGHCLNNTALRNFVDASRLQSFRLFNLDSIACMAAMNSICGYSQEPSKLGFVDISVEGYRMMGGLVTVPLLVRSW